MDRVVYLLPVLLCILYVHIVASDEHFTNQWVVEINGGIEHAKRVAEEHGYKLIRELYGLKNHYSLEHDSVPHRSKRSADHHTARLASDERILSAAQQEAKVRKKRGYKLETEARLYREAEYRRDEDRLYREIQDNLDDPQFLDQWYLFDQRTNLSTPKQDLHVLPVWNRNITGQGVTVCILDDGLEWTHDDLIQNYAPYASYDWNDNDDDPMPRYDPTNENKHGTRCAGEVSMAPNNHKCGVGVAFNAKIGGIRMLDGKVTDAVEAESIMYHAKQIDIYSASWGPNDDGRTLEGPGPLAKKAFIHGITYGRNGKGSIYVWASGNGGGLDDNCNCDGYTGSRYTISVSSASQGKEVPWYGERCASTMATTYSSGGPRDLKVVSTDLKNKCTDKHTGTSAAAPLAAGIFALLLEANPNLTWRDVQHLVAYTAQVDPLFHNKGWEMNGAGFFVNPAFGFGLLDATGLVDAADPATWQSVPEEFECVVNQTLNLPQRLRRDGGKRKMLEVVIHTSGCAGQTNEINYLEHVVLNITLDYSRRGDLTIELISPLETNTTLLSKRRIDSSKSGFDHWGLMSVHNWMESPRGEWKVIFYDSSKHENEGLVKDVSLTMYGTKDKPTYFKKRVYNFDYNQVKNEKRAEDSQIQDDEEPEDSVLGDSFGSEILKLALLKKFLYQV